MNKSLLIVASLALGTTAIAQTMPEGAPSQGSPPMTNTPAPGMPSGTDTTMPSQSGMQPADPNAPGGMMPPPADPGMMPPPADNGMAPPPSGGSMPMANGSGAMPTDTSSYPKCSRTVTDKCVQGGGMMHHGMMKRRPH